MTLYCVAVLYQVLEFLLWQYTAPRTNRVSSQTSLSLSVIVCVSVRVLVCMVYEDTNVYNDKTNMVTENLSVSL